MNNYTGSNSTYGKRKRSIGGGRSPFASGLSRKLFFRKGAGAPMLNPKTMDKMVGRALKSRMILSPEQKYIETVATAGIVSTTEVLVLLNGLVVGTTDNTRVGQKVRVTKIEFNAFIQLSGTAGLGLDVGKISLFIDKQANGAAPQFSTAVGSSVGSPYTDNGNAVCLKNATMEHQFYIIKDWDYTLDANAGVSGAWQADTVRLKCEVPINRVVCFNNGNSGLVADILTNAFYLGTLGSHPSGSSESSIQFIARVWYTDM